MNSNRYPEIQGLAIKYNVCNVRTMYAMQCIYISVPPKAVSIFPLVLFSEYVLVCRSNKIGDIYFLSCGPLMIVLLFAY